MAGSCSSNEDAKAKDTDDFNESVALQIQVYLATDPATFVGDHIADPVADLVEVYRLMQRYGTAAEIGQAVRRMCLNRMREAAEAEVTP
jgi:hypothetical protein